MFLHMIIIIGARAGDVCGFYAASKTGASPADNEEDDKENVGPRGAAAASRPAALARSPLRVCLTLYFFCPIYLVIFSHIS